MRYDPSGDMAGDESDHSPEKDAIVGLDHCPWIRLDSRMMDQRAVLRVKYKVLPSGEKVGAPSLAGFEIMPGEKISGVGKDWFAESANDIQANRHIKIALDHPRDISFS